MNELAIAQVAHEVNRAYCAALGDHSQALWHAAPQWQRDSAVNGVRFRLAYPGGSPSASHASWLCEKIKDGWSYGPVKDPAKKLHPCFVPYEQLPQEQRIKDYLFIGVVDSLANLLEDSPT